jgi:predicted peptidase
MSLLHMGGRVRGPRSTAQGPPVVPPVDPPGNPPPVTPPAANPTARFVVRTISIPADTSIDAIDLAFQAYIPSDAALAARGWLGQPYRIGVALHSSAEAGTNNTNQMSGAGLLPKYLGYPSSVRQDYPGLVIFPQKPATHTGPALAQGLSGGAIAFRLMYAAIPLMLAQIAAEFSGDLKKTWLTGVSQGGFLGFGLVYSQPALFKAFVPCASAASTAINTLPGVNVATNDDAADLVCPVIKNIPTRMYNSIGDTQVPPANYQYTVAKYGALSPADYLETEYASGDHGTVWTRAYQDVGSTLWPWLWRVLA